MLTKYNYGYIITTREVKSMSRCPKLDYESNTMFGNYSDKYVCLLTGMKMDVDDSRVKHVCKAAYGDEYKKCPIYRDKA